MVDSSHIALDESGLPPEQLVADVGVMDGELLFSFCRFPFSPPRHCSHTTNKHTNYN
jgi:hypothetical protein